MFKVYAKAVVKHWSLDCSQYYLEESGLAGVQRSRTSRNGHVQSGDRASLGGSGDLVLSDQLANLADVTVGEDEADVANNVGQQGKKLGVLLGLLANHLAQQGLWENH